MKILKLKAWNFRSPPPNPTIFSEPPFWVSKNFWSHPPQYLHSPLCHIKWTFPNDMEKICHTGGGNEATNFFHSSLTYLCFGTTILSFLTRCYAKNWQMQWNHQIQDDGAGNLIVIIFSIYYYIFCSVKCMGQLSLNNLRRHNVKTSLCKWHVL